MITVCLSARPPPEKHNKPEEASGHSHVKASSEDHPKHRDPRSQAVVSRRGSACSERRGFYWEHLTRKSRLVKLKVEQRNSPWSLSSYGVLAGTATTGHQGSTGLPDISQARTVPPSSVLPGYRKPESDTLVSYLPKSDPGCSQRQTTAYTQPPR